MNQERLLKVILAPVVSEKSNMLAEKTQSNGFQGAERCHQSGNQSCN